MMLLFSGIAFLILSKITQVVTRINFSKSQKLKHRSNMAQTMISLMYKVLAQKC